MKPILSACPNCGMRGAKQVEKGKDVAPYVRKVWAKCQHCGTLFPTHRLVDTAHLFRSLSVWPLVLALILWALLMASAASAQEIPDRDCSDFTTRLGAQAVYLYAQDQTGEEDYHGLDRDGNGVACEGISVIQVDSLTGVSGAYARLMARPGRVVCPDTSFQLDEYMKATREGFKGEGNHKVWHRMNQCVDLHLILRQNE